MRVPIAIEKPVTPTGEWRSIVGGPEYLELLGLPRSSAVSAREVWQHLAEVSGLLSPASPWRGPMEVILERGSLAERLRTATGLDPVPDGPDDLPQSRAKLRAVYRQLCDCLERGAVFTGEE